MHKLYLDFETRSRVDLKTVGAWAYASHPSTDIICIGYGADDRPVKVFPFKGEREPFFANHPIHIAHNVQFEYAIYHFILHKRYGWPELLDPKRWGCTMARALMCGLPASLEGAALSLRLPIKKDLEGRSALLKICKPQKDGTWNEDKTLYERVYAYNRIDVETERALDKALPELSTEERRIFELDLAINRRGIGVDIAAARQAEKIAQALTEDLNQELYNLTGGAVSRASRVAEMKRWIVSQGVKVPTVVKEEVEKETLDIEAVKDLIKDPTTPALVKKVIGIRQQVGKSSVAKFKAMLNTVCEDGRVRGVFQYHGAHTGRWAGRLIQPQNFPQGLIDDAQKAAIAMLGEGAGWFKAVYDSRSMQTLSDILRGMLIPSPGKVFVAADYNAIEARVLNWLAGEAWVLNLFERGESPYIRMAEGIYEKTGITKKTHPREYDIGKRSELGCGYGMGWARFQSNVYTETSKRGEGIELSDELAQKAVKVYRDAHKNVIGMWYEVEAAAINAVQNPEKWFACASGRVRWAYDRQYLGCKLPSGRVLRYFRPSIEMEKNRFDVIKPTLKYWTGAGEGAIKTDPTTNGLLGEYRTWGGELVENIVQAVARDIMAGSLYRVDQAELSIVLHAHDEIVIEVAEGRTEAAQLMLIDYMVVPFDWAKGCPIAAEGWIGRRYKK